MPMSNFDRQEISRIIAGHGDWFTAELLRLIHKADPQNRYKLSLGFPEEVAAVERWMLEPYEAEPADTSDEPDLGSCCACGGHGATVRNIVMMDKRAPVSGTGWGCVQCGLPPDGAVYVLCDECLEAKRKPQDVCRGFPKEGARVSIATITEPFEHDCEARKRANR